MTATLEKQPPESADSFATDLGNAALAELAEKKIVIAKLKAEFQGLSCATKEGYDQTHAAIQRLVKIRTSTDKHRLELGDGARKWVAMVNATAAEIDTFCRAIENPLRAMRDAVDEAAERKRQTKIDTERERLAAIERERIAAEAAKVKAAQDAENARLRVEAERLAAENAKLEKLRARTNLADAPCVKRSQARIFVTP